MKGKHILGVSGCALLMVALACPALAAEVYVQGLAPDWNQPYDYPDAYDGTGPGPDPQPGVLNAWNAWCTPTAAADLMGHWDDA